MESSNVIRWGGLAALLAGVVWLANAILIAMQAGSHNDALLRSSTLLFFTAPLFASLGLVGLHARLANRAGRLGRIGLVLAYIGLIGSAINVIYFVYMAYVAGVGKGINLAGPMNIGVPATIIGLLGGATLLGIATLRTKVLRSWANILPLVLGVLSIPIFILLQILMNRVAPPYTSGEVPTAVIGLGWLALGYAILVSRPAMVRDPVAAS